MLQVIEDSHFWTDIEMLIKWIQIQKTVNHSKNDILNYLEIGLTNTLKNGFNIEEKCKDHIVESVINKLKDRSNIGIKKYNTTLHDNNTDDFNNHLQMELMDACNYLEKLINKK